MEKLLNKPFKPKLIITKVEVVVVIEEEENQEEVQKEAKMEFSLNN